MVDFTTKSLTVHGKLVIDHGIVQSGYDIPIENITWPQIETLYDIYNNSAPDHDMQPALCSAKSETELSMYDIVFGIKRSQAQEEFEKTLLFGILNKTLVYPNPNQWFWQSSKYKNLIIPRDLFLPDTKTVRRRKVQIAENELWDRNLVAYKLRRILNNDVNQIVPWDRTFYHCFSIVKEEFTEKSSHRYFSDSIIAKLAKTYLMHLPKRYSAQKSTIGQYFAKLRTAKTHYQKAKAIENVLTNCPMYSYEYNDEQWCAAYDAFVNQKTLDFICEFMPEIHIPDFSVLSDAVIEQCVLDNKLAICDYISTH